MKWFKSVLLLLLTLVLGGCGGADGGYDFAPFTLVSYGNQSGQPDQQLRVVNSSAQLAELLSVMSISGTVPSTDFTTSRLVVITTGYNSGCGDYVGVERVDENDDTVLIRAVMGLPEVALVCPGAASADSPYVMLELAKSLKPVSVLFSLGHF